MREEGDLVTTIHVSREGRRVVQAPNLFADARVDFHLQESLVSRSHILKQTGSPLERSEIRWSFVQERAAPDNGFLLSDAAQTVESRR